jgi:hypothetical protein
MRLGSLAALLVFASGSITGCAPETPLALRLLAAEGADPFTMSGGATHARFVLEDGVTPAQTVAVGADGSFSVEIRPTHPDQRSRLRIEALRGEEVIATGATPPLVWQGRLGHDVAVLMHLRDTLLPAPVSFVTPRAEFRLMPLGLVGAAAVTVPSSANEEVAPDGYDLASHTRAPFTQRVPAEFDGDTSIVSVRSGWLLQRGARAALYTDQGMQPLEPVMGVPAERAALVAATAVDDVLAGGGWLIGGRAAGETASSRVDRVDNGARFTTPPPSLRVARVRPDVLPLRLPTESTAPLWLVAGGQREGDSLLESYSPTSGGATLGTGDARLDVRTGTALACLAVDALGCSRVLVLGGRDASGEASADDVLLDGVCARAGGVGCSLVLARGAWLAHRRWGARVGVAENGRVVVAGGRDADGAVREVETVDVSDPSAPRVGRVLQTLAYDDPAVLALSNGSVMIAGGRSPDGSPRGEIWFYRH